MEKKLRDLYKAATSYLCNESDNPFVVLDKAAEIYTEYGSTLSPQLQEVLGKCLCFINHDFEEPINFAKYVSYGDELIEEISGFVGEELEGTPKDINGKEIKVGQHCIWHDPEVEYQDLSRVWEIYGITEEIIFIADENGEAEALPNEIEIVE